MADYGLLPTGFVRQRLPEIMAELLASLKASTGYDFDTDPRKFTGQFNTVFSEREAALWEVVQAVYSAMYPNTAMGQALDDAVAFVGVRRMPASRTLVPAVLYGTVGTVIPADAIARSTIPSGNYLLDSAVTIGLANCADVTFAFNAVNNTAYTLVINGTGYSYTSDASATAAEIASGLGAVISAGSSAVVVDASGNTVLRLTQSSAAPFSVVTGSNISVSGPTIGSFGKFYRQDVGPVAPPVGTLTQIGTTVAGWASVTNNFEAAAGRYEESDTELRNRYPQGVFITGAGNVDSIAANLLQYVPNVSYARVYQNSGNSTDADGRDAHSVEAVVMGGLDQDIRNLLVKQVIGGIGTYGNVNGVAQDKQGVFHTVKFSRAVPVKAWAKVTVTKYTEESLSDNAGALIAQAVVDTGNSFGVGKDIIIQRFLGPIYDSVSGIGNIAVTVATGNAPAAGDYTSANVPISLRQISQWDISRVTVTIL